MDYKLINNSNFIKWCSLENHWMSYDEEYELVSWISEIWDNWHWSSKMTEQGALECLHKLWCNIWKAKYLENTTECKTPKWKLKRYEPDFECDKYVWEIKWCSWSSSWTAGEKILWTPLKYSEIPKIYNKPLIIVLMWYEEWEWRNWFPCWNLIDFNDRWNSNFINILKSFNESDIYYIWFTDLLSKINDCSDCNIL